MKRSISADRVSLDDTTKQRCLPSSSSGNPQQRSEYETVVNVHKNQSRISLRPDNIVTYRFAPRSSSPVTGSKKQDNLSENASTDARYLPEFVNFVDQVKTNTTHNSLVARSPVLTPDFEVENNDDVAITLHTDPEYEYEGCYREVLNVYNSYVPIVCEKIVKATATDVVRTTTWEGLTQSKLYLKTLVRLLIRDATNNGVFLNVKYLAWLIDVYAYQYRLRHKYVVCEYIGVKLEGTKGYTCYNEPDETAHQRPIAILINNLYYQEGDLYDINVCRATVLAHEMAHAADMYFNNEMHNNPKDEHGPNFKQQADHIANFTALSDVSLLSHRMGKITYDEGTVRVEVASVLRYLNV